MISGLLIGAGAEPRGRERIGWERAPREGAAATGSQDWRPSHKRPDRLGLLPLKDSFLDADGIADTSVKSQPPADIDSRTADRRERIASNVQGRYARGEAERPAVGGRPPLPPDTAQRRQDYYDYPEQRDLIPTAVPPFHGRDATSIAPVGNAFPWQKSAPQAELREDVPILNLFSGNKKKSFYGNYVGPMNEWYGEAPPPLTPVDKAAWYHDQDYGDIYDRYGYNEFEYGLSFTREMDRLFGTNLSAYEGAVETFGWLGQTTSLDPTMQMELAWADMKIGARSWAFMGEGIFKGFYSGDRGTEALATDLAWASTITVFHSALIAWRLGVMVPAGLIYQFARGLSGAISGLGQAIGGDVGKAVSWVGDSLGRIVSAAGQIFTFGSTFAAMGIVIGAGIAGAGVGGAVYVAAKVVEAVGNVIKDIGRKAGCYITTAVVRSAGEGDGGPTLSLLRRFRDEYVLRSPEGQRLERLYRETAPRIVAGIDRRVDRQAIWRWVYQRWIAPAAQLIRAERYVEAQRLYVQMVTALASMTRASLDYDGARMPSKFDPRLRL